MKLQFKISKREKEILRIIKRPLAAVICFYTWAIVALSNAPPITDTMFVLPTPVIVSIKGLLAYALGVGFALVATGFVLYLVLLSDLISVRLYTTWRHRHVVLRHEYKERRNAMKSKKDKKWGTQL